MILFALLTVFMLTGAAVAVHRVAAALRIDWGETLVWLGLAQVDESWSSPSPVHPARGPGRGRLHLVDG